MAMGTLYAKKHSDGTVSLFHDRAATRKLGTYSSMASAKSYASIGQRGGFGFEVVVLRARRRRRRG